MKKILPLLLFLLAACNENPSFQKNKHVPQAIEVKKPLSALIPAQQTIAVDESKLAKIPAGLPTVIPTNQNIHPAGEPKKILALSPRVITPGKDTFPLPKVIAVRDSPFVIVQPEPRAALPLRMKDAASANISYLDVDQGLGASYINAIFEDDDGNMWFATYGGGACRYDGKTFAHYTMKQGLNLDHIRAMLKDKRGNIWFCTDGGGACKYDGVHFTNYTESEGLISNSIWCALEDHEGNIWFGTNRGGVSKFDGKSFTNYSKKEGLSGRIVTSMIEDRMGNMWFGTLSRGVSKFNGKEFSHYTKKEGLSSNTILSICEDKHGNIWFGTDSGGVCKYDGNRVQAIRAGQKISEQDKDLKKVNGSLVESFTWYSQNEGLSGNGVNEIYEDKKGNLWFGVYSSGVCKFDGKSFIHYTEKEGLSGSNVLCIYEDRSGNMWFGTNDGGISRLAAESFIHYTEKEGLTTSYVRSMIEDRKGNIWFGTDGGGLFVYDGKSFANYSDKEGLSSKYVWAVYEDSNGNIWAGTYAGGVCKFDGKYFTAYTEKDGLSSTVLSIAEDNDGNMWFGTDMNGVFKYDGNRAEALTDDKDLKQEKEKPVKTFTHYTSKDGWGNNTVSSILKDKYGMLWFATNGGLARYDGKSFVNFTRKNGLATAEVTSLSEDRFGNIWFAAGGNGGGVCKYDGNRVEALQRGEKISPTKDLKQEGGKFLKSFTYYTEADGLTSNNVAAVRGDKAGNLWVTTDKGLNYIDRNGIRKAEDQDSIEKITTYHKEDGLKVEDFMPNSILLDSKDRIWLGAWKVLTMLHLNGFSSGAKAPEIHLGSIYIQEKFVNFGGLKRTGKDSSALSSNREFENIKFTDVVPFYNYPQDLKLPYALNHLTFNFSAIDWTAPHKISYQYKLDGLEHEWSQLSQENKADYRNIPYGNYTFKVKAIGASQEWSKTIDYPFAIHPPWWRTWWMYSIYALLLIAFVILIARLNARRHRERARELAVEVKKATVEIVKQKEVVEQQKHLIEEKHKEITDSINYAERIQRSFLATKGLLDENLGDYFVFFRPKDVVSGDFYWAARLQNGNFAYATADSTGHGVPGAIMSILNISSLEKSIESHSEPSAILDSTRKIIIERLKKDGSAEGGKDGMDVSLIILNKEKKKLTYSAAHNPVWIVRNGELTELSPDKMPVGKHDKDHVPFSQNEFILQSGDVIYSLTDGFPDQFGGPRGKKYKYAQLEAFLISISALPMHQQKEKLEEEFDRWKGKLEQIDDVTIIGCRV
jgi:ligand-binding sensor domain-containing protein/serine phosphatase RsbU (regulator of sigma subunit)